MITPNGGAAQARLVPTFLSPLMPFGSHGVHLGEGAAFTSIPPHYPIPLAEFRPRVRSLSGLHVAALAANNATEPTGPEAFDTRLLHWLTRTSDTLVIFSLDPIGPVATRLEAILRPARRALLVVTCFARQDAWFRALDAHARYSAGIHGLFETGEGKANELQPGIVIGRRSGPLQ